MPVNPAIALHALDVQPTNPMDLYARFSQLQALGDERKMRQMQIQQLRDKMDEETRKRVQGQNIRDAALGAVRTVTPSASYNTGSLNVGGMELPGRQATVQGPSSQQFDRSAFLQNLNGSDPLAAMDYQNQFATQDLEQQKQMALVKEALGKADKAKLDAIAQQLELTGRVMQSFKALPPEQKPRLYPSIIGAAVQQGWVQPGMLPEQYTPEIEPWLDAQIAQGQTVDQFVKAEQENRRINQTQEQNLATRENWKAQRELTKRGQDITMRGQNMTDARSREQNQIARDTKLEMNRAGETNQLASFTADMDRLAAAANEVKNHPGLAGITGIRGSFANVPGSQAANAQALLSTLKSQVGFSVLQNMRNNSKTGGALGQVSDRENQMLQDNLAALDKAQSYEAYQKSLQKIIDYTEQAKQRGREAIDRKYGMNQQGGSQPMFARNPQTGQRAVSYDGGQTWQAAQ